MLNTTSQAWHDVKQELISPQATFSNHEKIECAEYNGVEGAAVRRGRLPAPRAHRPAFWRAVAPPARSRARAARLNCKYCRIVQDKNNAFRAEHSRARPRPLTACAHALALSSRAQPHPLRDFLVSHTLHAPVCCATWTLALSQLLSSRVDEVLLAYGSSHRNHIIIT
jgi:hypothetical protein